jgi:outer membrane usher protein
MNNKIYHSLCLIFTTILISKAFANNDLVDDLLAYNIVTFDSSSLFGNKTPVDLSHFQTENYINSGIYRTSLFLNGQNIGDIDTKFDHLDGSLSAVLCIDDELINKINFTSDFLENIQKKECLLINDISKDAYYVFNKEILKLDLFIPQQFIQEYPKGYIDSNLFNKGVTSSFIGYNFNYNKENNSESKYLGLSGGLNLSDWYFRHIGNFEAHSRDFHQYNSSQNVLYKDINRLNSRLSLGQFNTQNYNIDSIPILGIQISSDAEMLPWSQRSYAPIIENVAYTNALINIYQNGQKIYEKNVPTGPFKISDLVTYADGDILLEINETGDEKRIFSIPFQNSFNLLKKGRLNYNTAIGQYYFKNKNSNDYIFQSNINYGLFNNITGILGLNITDRFYSLLLGSSISTTIGGFNLQLENQKVNHLNQYNDAQKININYKYNWIENNLSLTTNYEYNTEKYINLSNFIYEKNYKNTTNQNLNYEYSYGIKEAFGFYLTKGFKYLNFGNFNIGYRKNIYWYDNENTYQYYLNHSNSYKKINYNFNITKTNYTNNIYKDDLNLYLSINIPLQWNNKYLFINNSAQNTKDQTTLNSRISGNLGSHNEINFGLGIQQNFYNSENQESITGYINYHLPQTSLSSTINYNNNTSQYSLSTNGAIVAHPYGISLVGYIPETYTIIHAKNAKGTKVQNAWGVQIDRFGNAIYPFNTPYTFNTISLDPSDLSTNINLTINQTQVIPKKYSAQIALFETQKFSNILFNIHSLKSPPIGSQLYDTHNKVIGFLSPTQQIIIENENALNYSTKLIWGNHDNEFCIIEPINILTIKKVKTEFFNIIDVECI